MEIGTSLSYYDKILAAIAVSLGGGLFAGVVTTLRLHVGLLAGALLATIFVYHAVFRNPPPEVPLQVRAAVVVWHVFVGALLVTVLL